MSSKVDILLNLTEIVGSITFMPPASALPAYRTASGFRLHIPAMITFLPPTASQSPLLLENVQATFFASGEGGEKEIGTARYSETLTTGYRNQPIMFLWEWTLASLVFYERLRDGTEPTFRLAVSGTIRFLFPHGQNHQVCSTSSPFRADGHVKYSREAWTKTLRELNFRDSIPVEIPFESDAPTGWETVWDALRDARDAFEQGGSIGWNTCVAKVRLGLEKWRDIEALDFSVNDKKLRTKEQRSDYIRSALIEYAHYAPHTRADGWTRDDALLALSTFCALIATRRP